MNDRKKITIVLAAFIAVLATVLLVAAVPSYAGTWLQQYGKKGECAEGWGTSWAEWFNGPVCTREVDDPSQPVAAAPTPTPTLPPWPSGRWLQYVGNARVQSNPPGTGYGIFSSPFNACLWHDARVTGSPDVSVSAISENNWVQLHNVGTVEATGLRIEVLCD